MNLLPEDICCDIAGKTNSPADSGAISYFALGAGTYLVRDYENDRDLGSITGPVGELEVNISAHLLLEVLPQ